jgi:NADPH-dependent 2,4-dienoyl-CoA reductase/sulfur reductase-like enzyme
VTVVEMSGEVAAQANPRHRPELMRRLRESVTIYTGMRAKQITDEGILCVNTAGEEILIPADTVIVAAGIRPLDHAANALRGTAPIVELIGDCVRPGLIRDAVFRGYHAALDL